MAIIGISGKIGSGKDTIGTIIQYLVCLEKDVLHPEHRSFDVFKNARNMNSIQSGWDIKKYAAKLKKIISLFTGISVDDLEKEEVKNQVLPKEWWYWYMKLEGGYSPIMLDYLTTSKKDLMNYEGLQLIKPTVRQMLQEVGTEAIRNQIHPNAWINALFADYVHTYSATEKVLNRGLREGDADWQEGTLPNWIITDVRFPNELDAIKRRKGISIRVNRRLYNWESDLRGKFTTTTAFVEPLKNEDLKSVKRSTHPSETSLDEAQFDYVINNDGTIEELIQNVKKILIQERII